MHLSFLVITKEKKKMQLVESNLFFKKDQHTKYYT